MFKLCVGYCGVFEVHLRWVQWLHLISNLAKSRITATPSSTVIPMSTKLQSVSELQYQYPRRTRGASPVGPHTPWDKGSADDMLQLVNGMPILPARSSEKAICERLELERIVNTKMPDGIVTYGAAVTWLLNQRETDG